MCSSPFAQHLYFCYLKMATREELLKALSHIEGILEGLCLENLDDIYKDEAECNINFEALAREL